MENNMKAVHALSNSLNQLKGFETGYTTRNKSELLVSIEGVIYRVSIENVGTGEIDCDCVDIYL